MSRVSLSRFLSVGAGGEADAEIITDASRLRLARAARSFSAAAQTYSPPTAGWTAG